MLLGIGLVTAEFENIKMLRETTRHSKFIVADLLDTLRKKIYVLTNINMFQKICIKLTVYL